MVSFNIWLVISIRHESGWDPLKTASGHSEHPEPEVRGCPLGRRRGSSGREMPALALAQGGWVSWAWLLASSPAHCLPASAFQKANPGSLRVQIAPYFENEGSRNLSVFGLLASFKSTKAAAFADIPGRWLIFSSGKSLQALEDTSLGSLSPEGPCWGGRGVGWVGANLPLQGPDACQAALAGPPSDETTITDNAHHLHMVRLLCRCYVAAIFALMLLL